MATTSALGVPNFPQSQQQVFGFVHIFVILQGGPWYRTIQLFIAITFIGKPMETTSWGYTV